MAAGLVLVSIYEGEEHENLNKPGCLSQNKTISQCTCNLTLKSVCITIVAVDKQQMLSW
jgi:hypothetical protein